MTQDTSLSELVLGYCRQVGALVEPPAYGVTETLLPDEVAARWGVTPHQRFVFDAANNHAERGAVFLHYGHALVETIVDELRGQSADGQFFINNVRPEKPGLFAAVEKTFSLPNAKIFPIPMAKEQARLHHYARFNFKVSLIADEKRELILPLWMDLQNGYPVKGADIERFGILDPENDYAQTPPAPAFWNDEPALTPKTLAALLERARQSVAGELGETLSHLQKRLARFLELDRARLGDYYADLLKDAERRLKKADEDRHPALESKIAAIVAERESKLADVEQKYLLRVQLELVSLAVVALPKLDLTVEVRKRAVTIKRTVSWNPLLHIVDALACDVCNHSGTTLQLCENGHLAHTDCLAPQCVECKRTFCQTCAHEVTTCAVCDRPICVHSLTRCAECKRVTCSEHVGECHALGGEPRKIVVGGKKAEITKSAKEEKESSHKMEAAPKEKKPSKREWPKVRTFPQKISAPPKPLADYVEVYADPSEGTITAYMMRRQHELAVRWWSLTEEGISVRCQCEKMWQCEANGMVHRPSPSGDIERQMDYLLGLFREEYNLPDKKTRYFQIRLGKPFDEKKLKVPSSWKDEGTLERARRGFDELSRKKGKG
jgi:hypothetical protein